MSYHEPLLHITLGCAYLFVVHAAWTFHLQGEEISRSRTRGVLDYFVRFLVLAWDIVLIVCAGVYYFEKKGTASELTTNRYFAAGFLMVLSFLVKLAMGASKVWNSNKDNEVRTLDVISYHTEDSKDSSDNKNDVLATGSIGAFAFALYYIAISVFCSLSESNSWMPTGTAPALKTWNIMSISMNTILLVMTIFLFWSQDYLMKAKFCAINNAYHISGTPDLVEEKGVSRGLVSSVFLFRIPYPIIIPYTLLTLSAFAEYLNSNGQFMHLVVFIGFYPFMSVAFHRTFAAWAEAFVLGMHAWFQMFWFFPAFKLLTGNTMLPSGDAVNRHLNFLNDWSDTALIYRIDADDTKFFNFVRYALPIASIFYLAFGMIAALSSNSFKSNLKTRMMIAADKARARFGSGLGDDEKSV